MPVRLNADHIAGSLEPQRTNNFVLLLNVGGDMIQKSIESFPIPKESNPPIEVSYGNEKRKVAGVATFESVTFDIKDFIDSNISKKLTAWYDEVYDAKTAQIGYAKNYKQNGAMRMLGPDGAVSREWDLVGCWPTKINPGGGDMSSNTNNLVSITMRVDKVIEN